MKSIICTSLWLLLSFSNSHAMDIQTNDNWTKTEIKELLEFQPKWRLFGDNSFRKVTNLFLFCRKDRNYPCLMVMRDGDGNLVKKDNGEVWSQPKLAQSSRGLSYDQSRGATPQGLFTIESVMPKADRQLIYGKFRRIKLDFIKKSNKDKDYLQFIPERLQEMNWWRESIIARDNGRSLFRIHGVGYQNTDPSTSYYPFIPTAGCVASLEGTYDGVEYSDQRELLDRFMTSMGLEPKYDNETKIKGLLYVVNIDDGEAPVELSDIL